MQSHYPTTNPFIGREQELGVFKAWLDHPDAPLSIITLSGISGVGKSTLLSEFIRLGAERTVLNLWLDGRACAPTPTAFIDYLSATISLETMQTPLHHPIEPLIEASPTRRVVLCIDNYEDLCLLERWIMNTLFPKLPLKGIMIVLASRPALSINWLSNPMLQAVIHHINLTNFTLEETKSYWAARGALSKDMIGTIYRMTEGHPLALALSYTTVVQQSCTIDEDKLIVSQHISAQLLRELTDDKLHLLVDVLAIMQSANQELLSLIIKSPVSMNEYQALKNLSFIRTTPFGLSLHDVARNHLVRDFKLREPERHRLLLNQILVVLRQKLELADRASRRHIAAQMLMLCKNTLPVLNRAYADLSTEPYMWSTEACHDKDLPALHQLLREWCQYSLDPGQSDNYHQLLDKLVLHFPESIAVLRSPEGEPIGMSIIVLVHEETSHLLQTYCPYELAETCEPDMLKLEPARADTYFAVLVAATSNYPGYSREELVGQLILDRLSLLGEGTRAVLAATNAHLKQFLQQLGFELKPTRTRNCDTSFAQADVLTLDLRIHNFGEWVQSFLHHTGANAAKKRETAHSIEALTVRELEVLQLIANGLSNKEIADLLIVSNETIKTHVRNIFYKLKVDRRMKAVTTAKELGLIGVD
jgi:DNA-binding CsgD family transcriptional regulator